MTARTLTRVNEAAKMVGYGAFDKVFIYDPSTGGYHHLGTYVTGGPFNSALAAQYLTDQPVALVSLVASENPPDMSEFQNVCFEPIFVEGRLRENSVYLGGDRDDEPEHGMSSFRITEYHIGQFRDHLRMVQPGQPVAFTGSLAPGETAEHRASLVRMVKAQHGRPVIDTRPEVLLDMRRSDPGLLDGVIIKQNERELARLVAPGHLNGYPSWVKESRKWSEGSTFVITRHDCTLVVTADEAWRIHLDPQFRPQVVCRVGCGDCTVAGIAVSLPKGIVQAVCDGKGASQANVENHRPGRISRDRAKSLSSHMVIEPIH